MWYEIEVLFNYPRFTVRNPNKANQPRINDLH